MGVVKSNNPSAGSYIEGQHCFICLLSLAVFLSLAMCCHIAMFLGTLTPPTVNQCNSIKTLLHNVSSGQMLHKVPSHTKQAYHCKNITDRRTHTNTNARELRISRRPCLLFLQALHCRSPTLPLPLTVIGSWSLACDPHPLQTATLAREMVSDQVELSG